MARNVTTSTLRPLPACPAGEGVHIAFRGIGPPPFIVLLAALPEQSYAKSRRGIGISAVPSLPKAVKGVRLPYPALDF